MDIHNATLKQLLDTLSKNSGSADWNMYKNNRGKIVVKICFDEAQDKTDTKPDINLDIEDSFGVKSRTVSDNQSKRNYLRARSYSKKRKLSSSPEISRNFSNSKKDPGNIGNIYSPQCLSTESLAHITEVSACSDSLIQSSPEASACLLNLSELSAMQEGSNDAGLEKSAEKDQAVYDTSSISQVSLMHEPYTPTPFDSDNESNYDNNAEYLNQWPEYREPCGKSGCYYRPSDLEGYNVNDQLGLRPNGTHEWYYMCELCGRKFCDECLWNRRRHLHHMQFVRRYGRKGPTKSGYVKISNVMNGVF